MNKVAVYISLIICCPFNGFTQDNFRKALREFNNFFTSISDQTASYDPNDTNLSIIGPVVRISDRSDTVAIIDYMESTDDFRTNGWFNSYLFHPADCGFMVNDTIIAFGKYSGSPPDFLGTYVNKYSHEPTHNNKGTSKSTYYPIKTVSSDSLDRMVKLWWYIRSEMDFQRYIDNAIELFSDISDGIIRVQLYDRFSNFVTKKGLVLIYYKKEAHEIHQYDIDFFQRKNPTGQFRTIELPKLFIDYDTQELVILVLNEKFIKVQPRFSLEKEIRITLNISKEDLLKYKEFLDNTLSDIYDTFRKYVEADSYQDI